MNISTLGGPLGATIRSVEQDIETLLDKLSMYRHGDSREAADFLLEGLQRRLAPPECRVSAQLEEDGRKKRSSAAASNWTFSSGEIVLMFEPRDQRPEEVATRVLAQTSNFDSSVSVTAPPINTAQHTTSQELRECCQALAEAERGGRPFVALKWFRDLALAGLAYEWTRTAEDRQRVLNATIEGGAIATKRIPNPRSPMHPTTTLTLNRDISSDDAPSRFNPVSIQGEPVSATLLRDRGAY